MALLMITSRSSRDASQQILTSNLTCGPANSAARMTVSGDESRPTICAPGQRWANEAVSWPGPQPEIDHQLRIDGVNSAQQIHKRTRALTGELEVPDGIPDRSRTLLGSES